MSRATIQNVKDVYAGSGATDSEISAAIAIASTLVKDRLVGKLGATESLLVQIETLLGAHFLVINRERGGLRSQGLGEAQDAYNVEPGAGLSATRYGQQAIVLDPTGVLVKLGKKSASFKAYPLALTPAG